MKKQTNGYLSDNGGRSGKVFKKKNAKKLNNNVSSNHEYYRQYNKMVNQKTKKAKTVKKVLLIILCVILGIAIIIASVFAYLYYTGKSELAYDDEFKLSVPDNIESDNGGKTVTVDGQKYVFDDDVTSILCIGVDKDTKTQKKTEVIGNSGQADALYLLTVDNVEKKYTVLTINRDSMAFIDLYTSSGEYSGEQKNQICLSFAYGDGKTKSCQNTVKAVSRMLYNIPIRTYFSINKACIPLLNDIIGGVEVPVYDNNGNVTGETKLLEGDEAYNYIHYRDLSKLDSNTVRIKRQTSFIKAFASKFIARTKEDLSTPLNIFDTVSIYSTTNIDASKVTYLATNAFTGRSDISIDYKSVPGEVVKGKDGYAEYHVDNNELLKVVLDIFYDKVGTTQPAATTVKK